MQATDWGKIWNYESARTIENTTISAIAIYPDGTVIAIHEDKKEQTND